MTTPDYAAIEAACQIAAEELPTLWKDRYDTEPWWLAFARPYILEAARVAKERDELREAAREVLDWMSHSPECATNKYRSAEWECSCELRLLKAALERKPQ